MSSGKAYWFRRNPGKFLFLMVTGFALLVLVGTELALRIQGFVPGQLGPEPLHHLPGKVKVKGDYFVDEYGIMRVHPDFGREVNAIVQGEREIREEEFDYSLEMVAKEFSAISRREINSEFTRALPTDPSSDPRAPLMGTYLRSPINAEGFRSLPFDTVPGDTKRVLLLGDSFTWGLVADPLTNSFADRLLARGYTVYNTGIIGTDPAQYLGIARRYLPRLKPQVVLLNFFLGNDQMDYLRQPEPGKAVIHATRFGWLEGFVEGCYLGPRESLVRNPRYAMLPDSGSPAMEICSATVLGTRLWSALGLQAGAPEASETDCLEKGQPDLSEWYVTEIRKLCESHGARLEVALIPNRKALPGEPSEITDTYEEMVAKCFPTETVHTIRGLGEGDFAPDDDHFNNEGMKKWADFLETLIRGNEP